LRRLNDKQYLNGLATSLRKSDTKLASRNLLNRFIHCDDKDEDMPNIEDSAFYPYKPSKRPLPTSTPDKVYKVLSSKGDKEYEVNTNASGSLECSCVGYGYRRKCRHIDQITSTL
jgi:hypothetical protein